MWVLLKLYFLVGSASAARILGVVLTPTYSHQVVFKPLWRELSLRGHQVTTITSHPLKDARLTNLTEIDLSVSTQYPIKRAIKHMMEDSNMNIVQKTRRMYPLMVNMMDTQLGHPAVRKLLDNNKAKFDLVIMEHLWNSALAFAVRFNCPYIGMLSIDAPSELLKYVGNPVHSSLYPDMHFPYGKKLSLSERVTSFVVDIGLALYKEHVVEKLDQKLIEKHFGSNYPPIREIAQNISMLFVNADPIFHHNRPLVPAVVQIGGGSHRSPPKPLPKDLQMLLDNATNGFIYFSLGSNVQSEYLPEKTIKTILDVFTELPYTVLWKFGEEIPDKPKNVVISKWLPQEDVLRHPNIKLFITQGGLQSMDEAIHSHVPMVGIPFIGDQQYNVRKMENMGFGLAIDPAEIERDRFKQAISEVIDNPRYRNTLTKLAELARDQPMSGIEKAVWWTEYVIRHKGAKHLRSPLLDIPWYQYLLLDVIGTLLIIASVTLLIVVFILRSLIRFISRKVKGLSALRTKKSQ